MMKKEYTFTPHPLFDALLDDMRKRGDKSVRVNDAALCRLLDVLPPTLSKMRKGKLLVSDAVRVRVMRKFGWSMKRMDALAPPPAGAEGQAE